eukprot:3838811-Alexandrium_andersonii.AAC.1
MPIPPTMSMATSRLALQDATLSPPTFTSGTLAPPLAASRPHACVLLACTICPGSRALVARLALRQREPLLRAKRCRAGVGIHVPPALCCVPARDALMPHFR